MKDMIFDDPEFIRFLIGRMSVSDIQAAFDQYIDVLNEQETFEQWLTRLHCKPEIMTILHSLWQYDQTGKARQEKINVKLIASVLRPKNKMTPITDEQIEAFSQYIANNGLKGLRKS